MRKKILIFLLLSCFILPLWADEPDDQDVDSNASSQSIDAAETSGITFEKTPGLVLQAETLTLRKQKFKPEGEDYFTVDVDYQFTNTTSQDLKRMITFALPPVDCDSDNISSWKGLDYTSGNKAYDKALRDFTLSVDGKSRNFFTRLEALMDGKQVTDKLIQNQLPLNPCLIKVSAEGRPAPKYYKILRKENLLSEEGEVGWTENIYHDWMQTFPASQVTTIHLHYSTPYGGDQPDSRTIDDLNTEFTQNDPPLTPVWNYNPAKLATTHSNLVMSDSLDRFDNHKHFCLSPQWVEYHLRNPSLNGEIATFKLIIEDAAKSPFAVNEFYGNDDKVNLSYQRKKLVFTLQHFTPQKDLFLQFLSLPKDAKACKKSD